MSQLFTHASNLRANLKAFYGTRNSSYFDFTDAETGVSLIPFDSLLSYHVRSEGCTVSAPVEQGSFASYNKVQYPGAIEVQIASTGTDDTLQAILSVLHGLQAQARTFHFITPTAEYSHYTLESYDFSMSQKDGLGVLYVTLKLVEIREVIPQYTDTKSISENDAANAGDVSALDRGRVQAQAATATQESMLAELFSSGGGL